MGQEERAAGIERAIFSGNCYWSLQEAFRRVRGVERATSGHYSLEGHEESFPGRDRVEAVRVDYDPSRIGFGDLLELFFAAHDARANPWEDGACFCALARSAVMVFSEGQGKAARERVGSFAAGEEPWTKVLEAREGAFREAGEAEQDYCRKNPREGYCAGVAGPKMERLAKRFDFFE